MRLQVWVAALALVLVVSSCKKSLTAEDLASAYLVSDDFNRSDEALSASSDWSVYLPSGATLNIVSQSLKPHPGSDCPSAFFNTAVTETSTASTLTVGATGTMSSPYALIMTANTKSFSTMTKYQYCGFAGSRRISAYAYDGSNNDAATGTVTFPMNASAAKVTVTAVIDSTSITCSAISADGTYTDSVTISSLNTNNYYGMFACDSDGSDNVTLDDFGVATLE